MKKKICLLLAALLLISILVLTLCSCNLFDKDDDTDYEQIELQKYQERKDKIQTDSRLSIFDENKINEIVGKYETIAADSDEYKNMSDKEKDQLVEKLIVSEILQEEIKAEELNVQAQKEEVKRKLCGFSTELTEILNSNDLTQTEQVAGVAEAINNVKQELQETIDSDSSSPEEIAAAKEQLKQVEAAEQEYAYHETATSITETVNNDDSFSMRNIGIRLEKLRGTYKIRGRIYVNADFIKTEVIAGVEICSQINGFCQISCMSPISEDVNYTDMIAAINNCGGTIFITTCANRNNESHKSYFEQNKYSMASFISRYEGFGYTYDVFESWENEDNETEFIIKEKRGGSSKLYFVTSNGGRYSFQEIEKICPEFWAQKELEESKQNAEAEASAVEEFVVCDQDGNVTGFDWNAYHASKDQNNTQTTTETVKEVNKLLYDDLELGL